MTKDQAASPAVETVIAQLEDTVRWLSRIGGERTYVPLGHCVAHAKSVEQAIAALASQQALREMMRTLVGKWQREGSEKLSWSSHYAAGYEDAKVECADELDAALTRASSQEEPGAATPEHYLPIRYRETERRKD